MKPCLLPQDQIALHLEEANTFSPMTNNVFQTMLCLNITDFSA